MTKPKAELLFLQLYLQFMHHANTYMHTRGFQLDYDPSLLNMYSIKLQKNTEGASCQRLKVLLN